LRDPFCGKTEERPTWIIEKFLAEAKHFGFKDVHLERVAIPKPDKGNYFLIRLIMCLLQQLL
jgi:hypothetical protein